MATNRSLPILRARLEIERTLRGREFFARATAGRLAKEEYRELVAQWAMLAEIVVADPTTVMDLAAQDVGPLHDVLPCPSLLLARGFLMSFKAELVTLSTLSVMGTSWTGDAVEHGRKRGRKCALLDEISGRSMSATGELMERVEKGTADAHNVYALVEAMRGVVLGVATYLDMTWRPPTFSIKLDLN